MSGLRKGDRVIATEAVNVGFFASVEKGTKGVIAEVESAFMTDDTYEVHWETGEKATGVHGRALARLAKEEVDDGCLMLVLASALVAGVAWSLRPR